MYDTLLTLHAIFKWLVLLMLIITVTNSFFCFYKNSTFGKVSNGLRHWTATTAHIQLIFGIILYTQSPIIKHFWSNFNHAARSLDSLFFGVIHILLMLIAIIIITVGSAKVKRKQSDKDKFKTVMLWFIIGLIIILIAIPWPFSPLASRPYIRTF